MVNLSSTEGVMICRWTFCDGCMVRKFQRVTIYLLMFLATMTWPVYPRPKRYGIVREATLYQPLKNNEKHALPTGALWTWGYRHYDVIDD